MESNLTRVSCSARTAKEDAEIARPQPYGPPAPTSTEYSLLVSFTSAFVELYPLPCFVVAHTALLCGRSCGFRFLFGFGQRNLHSGLPKVKMSRPVNLSVTPIEFWLLEVGASILDGSFQFQAVQQLFQLFLGYLDIESGQSIHTKSVEIFTTFPNSAHMQFVNGQNGSNCNLNIIVEFGFVLSVCALAVRGYFQNFRCKISYLTYN